MRSARLPGFLLGCLAAFCLAPVRAGTIVGTVRGEGPKVPGSPAGGGGAYSSQRYKFAERIDYQRLQNFVVYVDQPVDEPGRPPPKMRTITQRDVSFDPPITAIKVGTTILWPNRDDIFHNVFSMSDTKEFNLGLYTKDDQPPTVTFDKVGRVDVFCSIHSKMHCIILVVPSRFIAIVNSGKTYVLSNLPAGTYKVKAWHELLPAQERTVTVPAEGEVRADFVLSVAGLPKD